jgi:hypothetical protein
VQGVGPWQHELSVYMPTAEQMAKCAKRLAEMAKWLGSLGGVLDEGLRCGYRATRVRVVDCRTGGREDGSPRRVPNAITVSRPPPAPRDHRPQQIERLLLDRVSPAQQVIMQPLPVSD